MKRINYLFFMALAIGIMASCAEKKKSNIIIAPKPVAKVKKQTLKMSEYEQSRSIEWLGATYKVVVKREADDSLPLVKVDENTKYHDNKINSLYVGSNKVFTAIVNAEADIQEVEWSVTLCSKSSKNSFSGSFKFIFLLY